MATNCISNDNQHPSAYTIEQQVAKIGKIPWHLGVVFAVHAVFFVVVSYLQRLTGSPFRMKPLAHL